MLHDQTQNTQPELSIESSMLFLKPWRVYCRPGRLDKVLYVPLPPPEGRGAILQALTRKTPLAVDVNVAAVGASPQCHGFSGADLAALVREACICALKVYSQGF